jgi:quercetin dioxygenase-like cupin family protein
MKRIDVVVAVATIAGFVAFAQRARTDETTGKTATIFVESDLKWNDAEGMPPGTKMAVLVGDPKQAGPYVLRLKLPAGWKIPPHTHPQDENVTVLSGTVSFGTGVTVVESAFKEMPAGSMVHVPAGVEHFARSTGGGVVQLHGIGPFELHLVNPSDQPPAK